MCYGKLFSWQWQQEQHLYLPTPLHCVNFWYYKVREKKKKRETCACAHTHIKHTGLGDSANILHVVQKVTLTLGGTVTKKKKLNREPEDSF